MAKQNEGEDTKKYNPPESTDQPKAETPKSKPPTKKEPAKKSTFPVEPLDLVKIVKGELDPPKHVKRLAFNRYRIEFDKDFVTDNAEEIPVYLNIYTGKLQELFPANLIGKTKFEFIVHGKRYFSSTPHI